VRLDAEPTLGSCDPRGDGDAVEGAGLLDGWIAAGVVALGAAGLTVGSARAEPTGTRSAPASSAVAGRVAPRLTPRV
jgi:hypothetical protein